MLNQCSIFLERRLSRVKSRMAPMPLTSTATLCGGSRRSIWNPLTAIWANDSNNRILYIMIDTINTLSGMDLFYSLRAPYRRNAVFLMNDSTIKAIRKLKNLSGDYLWQPSVQTGEPDRLLGRPIYTSTFMPEIESGAKVIAFGDMSYYWIADRTARTFKRLDELYAPTGQVGFLGAERVDGKLILPEAIKILAMKTSANSGN